MTQTGAPSWEWKPPSASAAGKQKTPPAITIGALRLRPRWRLRRITLLAALALAACSLVPGGLSMLLPRTYGGQVELLLKPRYELSDTAVERAMLTEEVILTSPAVLAPVAAGAGIPLEALQAAVTTSMVGRSNVLRLTVEDPQRERALTLVGAIERQYAALHVADAEVDPTSPEGPTLTSTTLTGPRLLAEPLSPRPLRAVAGGALVGLVLAVGMALLLLRPVTVGRPPPAR